MESKEILPESERDHWRQMVEDGFDGMPIRIFKALESAESDNQKLREEIEDLKQNEIILEEGHKLSVQKMREENERLKVDVARLQEWHNNNVHKIKDLEDKVREYEKLLTKNPFKKG